MTDRQARTQDEIDARREIVSRAQAMIDGKLSFLEGAVGMSGLILDAGGIIFEDQDHATFMVIADETDHLPLERCRPLWQPEALVRLEPEFKKSEEWARSIGLKACKNLIARFGKD